VASDEWRVKKKGLSLTRHSPLVTRHSFLVPRLEDVHPLIELVGADALGRFACRTRRSRLSRSCSLMLMQALCARACQVIKLTGIQSGLSGFVRPIDPGCRRIGWTFARTLRECVPGSLG
jgi:hypothetical protein